MQSIQWGRRIGHFQAGLSLFLPSLIDSSRATLSLGYNWWTHSPALCPLLYISNILGVAFGRNLLCGTGCALFDWVSWNSNAPTQHYYSISPCSIHHSQSLPCSCSPGPLLFCPWNGRCLMFAWKKSLHFNSKPLPPPIFLFICVCFYFHCVFNFILLLSFSSLSICNHLAKGNVNSG